VNGKRKRQPAYEKALIGLMNGALDGSIGVTKTQGCFKDAREYADERGLCIMDINGRPASFEIDEDKRAEAKARLIRQLRGK